MSTDGRTPGGGDPLGTTFATRRKARRRVVHNGNSYTVALPLEFRSRLGILPTSELELTLYEEHGGFFVRAIVPVGALPFSSKA